MGSLFSIFRSKTGTKDLLEKIQNEIESIEDYKWVAIRRQKNYIGFLYVISLIVVVFGSLHCFFYFPRTSDLTLKILYFVPLIVTPFIIWSLKWCLQWYYRWSIDQKDETLRRLKKEKKKILDKVQETETFKEAKEILEKYDPKALAELSFRNMNVSSTAMMSNLTPQMAQMNLSNAQMRYRGSATPQIRANPMPAMNRMSTPTPQLANTRPYLMARPSGMTPIQPQRLAIMPAIYPQTVKPILPQERGIMEKLVDYVVGDGPSNRYALICIHCHSHNGMALKEEFEYIQYKCCYCHRFNPPRKMKPLPPRLGPLTQTNRSSLTPVVDEPESDTDSTKGVVGSEDNSKMKIEEISNETEVEANRIENPRDPEPEPEEPSITHSREVHNLSESNHIIEDLETNKETKENFSETEKSLNTKDSENVNNEIEEDITFIDESDDLLSEDKSAVLL